MNYIEIRKEREEKTNKLFTDCGVFWAFSNEQFKEGLEKTTLAEGEKLVDIGAGGFMPKSKVEALTSGMKAIDKEFKEKMRDAKMREKHILYELNNHEAYYTNRITDAKDALGDDYTDEEILTVYKKYKAQKYVCN